MPSLAIMPKVSMMTGLLYRNEAYAFISYNAQSMTGLLYRNGDYAFISYNAKSKYND